MYSTNITKYWELKFMLLRKKIESFPAWIKDHWYVMCSSRKYPYSPYRGDWNSLGGGPKKWNKCIKLNWKFQTDREVLGRYGSVLELHNDKNQNLLINITFVLSLSRIPSSPSISLCSRLCLFLTPIISILSLHPTILNRKWM